MLKDRFIEFRKDLGLTQTEVSNIIGVARGTVQSWESGSSAIGSRPLMKIFENWPDLSADWLLKGEGEMYGKPNSTEMLIEQGHNGMVVYLKLLEDKIAHNEQRIRRMERVMKNSTNQKRE